MGKRPQQGTYSYDGLSDEELVGKITKSNNALLFGVLYDRYVERVYNKCYGFSKSEKEAEDLTQDVFLLLFVKLASFKGMSKFSSWLYSFTYNFCVNYVNRDKARKMRDNSTNIEDKAHELPVDVPDKDILEMRSGKLKRALDRIDAEDKSILLLKYQDDVSIKELAVLLEIGESAVKMRLKRAKARIVEIYNTLP
ncbi:RNA polymerase sigma factor [Costertonia aggregata]|uniref:RNA polymerase sigma factor n=1 Tax=Costertonia aggregata TaxID=343403 RepID=A0A7H9AUQ5_9FLAO|nr:RNA polymerase sigma factor [Costertonia aggregata]